MQIHLEECSVKYITDPQCSSVSIFLQIQITPLPSFLPSAFLQHTYTEQATTLYI